MKDTNHLLKKLWRDKSARIGMLIIAVITLSALAAPLLTPYEPNTQDLSIAAQAPSLGHPLGTDFYGRDLLTRLIYGARVSLGIGLCATLLAVLVGTTVGLISGYSGGWVDNILMRIVDVLLGFPRLFVILLAVGLSTPSVKIIILILGALSWMEIARIVRGEVIVIREMLYVKSAVALGISKRKILLEYILPNTTDVITVYATLLIGTTIIVEASLSFLGLGVQPPDASWGTIINQGRIDPVNSWWISTFAGLAIVITVIGINLLGDSLRSLLNPRTDQN
ncbi:MAG: ABC transporter permease [Candidatus Marinimicrobia bacterium]|nr:ABC transporter permease [Candidatus Neomarinimicrobiota bacterium]